VPLADVERVVEQRLVVGADVEGDRDDPAGVDAGGGGVDGELACGDAGAAAHSQSPMPRICSASEATTRSTSSASRPKLRKARSMPPMSSMDR
jgi:hypothetical protein